MGKTAEELKEKSKKIGHRAQNTEGRWVLAFGKIIATGGQKNYHSTMVALPRHKRSRQLHLMFKPYPFAMDILVYTPKEVEAESQFELSFISRVLREGKRLYGQTV